MSNKERITVDYIRDNYKLHHIATCRGYQSKKGDDWKNYKGRFGEGYVIYRNYSRSTQYKIVEYYIEKVDHVNK